MTWQPSKLSRIRHGSFGEKYSRGVSRPSSTVERFLDWVRVSHERIFIVRSPVQVHLHDGRFPMLGHIPARRTLPGDGSLPDSRPFHSRVPTLDARGQVVHLPAQGFELRGQG